LQGCTARGGGGVGLGGDATEALEERGGQDRGVGAHLEGLGVSCAHHEADSYAIFVINHRYANYMQLDVASPAAVTASTTGIAVVQSVVELTASSAVSLVRVSVLTPTATVHAASIDLMALSSDFGAWADRTPPQHARSTAAPRTRYLERVTHSSLLMGSRLRGSSLR
jgi:hypothetical protein